ncbi:MAG: GAF domain-containing protein, partial [Bacteroidales bacterium]
YNKKIKLKHKILGGILVLYVLFGFLIIVAINSISRQESEVYLLQKFIVIQNGLIEIKDLLQKDYMKSVELSEQTTEEEMETRWKDHIMIQEDIFSELQSIQDYNQEKSVDLIEIKNLYENIFLPSYKDLYKTKLKETVSVTPVNQGDSEQNIQEKETIKTEITDILMSLRSKSDNINLKIAKTINAIETNVHSGIEKNLASTKQQKYELLVISIITVIVSAFFLYMIVSIIFRSLSEMQMFVSRLQKGDLSYTIKTKSTDEIGEMINNLNNLIQSIRKIAHSLNDIGDNKFDTEYTLLSDKDELGHAFLKMKEKLKKSDELANKLKEQEKIQNWATAGVAKFADILRQQTNNYNELSYNIIKSLVEYVHANQGGIFMLNDEDEMREPYLELMATYAYGRKKFKERIIKMGEGLVGTCALEGESIFMTNIPEGYIEIESYLGHSSPKCLLIVPLKLNSKVFGIIEIASFEVFKDYEIKFIEELAGTIASTLSSAKINQKTAELLEKSKQQSEQMLAQEEEMRQNLEELQSTQEEAARRERVLNEELEHARKEIDRLRKELNEQKRKASVDV